MTVKRSPTHPDAIFLNMPAFDMSVTGAAEALGVSRQQVHRVRSEKAPITPEMALA